MAVCTRKVYTITLGETRVARKSFVNDWDLEDYLLQLARHGVIEYEDLGDVEVTVDHLVLDEVDDVVIDPLEGRPHIELEDMELEVV